MTTDKPMALNDRETATLLHALRTLQELADGPADCVAACCEHFDGTEPLTNAEIDGLCERLNFYDVAVMPPMQGKCIPADELRADLEALSPEERAIVDALPQGPTEDDEEK
jgi:hypothetical protein